MKPTVEENPDYTPPVTVSRFIAVAESVKTFITFTL